jgi:hypothetical protein
MGMSFPCEGCYPGGAWVIKPVIFYNINVIRRDTILAGWEEAVQEVLDYKVNCAVVFSLPYVGECFGKDGEVFNGDWFYVNEAGFGTVMGSCVTPGVEGGDVAYSYL